jgi:creatinine amidohydrolase
MKKVQYEKMTWKEIQAAIVESQGIAILPVGAVEEHGPHNPVGTDSIETYEIGLRAAQQADTVILPLVWFGNSRSLLDFPGSIAIHPDILKSYVREVLLSLIRQGFNRPLLLDGHSGNYGALDILVEDIMCDVGLKVLHVRAWELASIPKPPDTPQYDGHGGLSETSAMLYLMPDCVDQESMQDSSPEVDLTNFGSVFPTPSSLYAKGAVVFPMMMGELVEAGHLGDPRLASSERGKALIDAKANALAQFIDLLKKDSVYWRGKK